MALSCCACTTVLIVPAPYRIVAQFRDAARGDASRREASRTGGLGAIAGGLEGGTARPTSTVIHPSRLCDAPVLRTRVMRQPRVSVGRAGMMAPGEVEHGVERPRRGCGSAGSSGVGPGCRCGGTAR